MSSLSCPTLFCFGCALPHRQQVSVLSTGRYKYKTAPTTKLFYRPFYFLTSQNVKGASQVSLYRPYIICDIRIASIKRVHCLIYERRQKARWKNSCKRDREGIGLKEEDVLDRKKWKNDIHIHSGDPLQKIGKARGEDEDDCLRGFILQ